jgi:hypothetical protein
MTRRASRQGWIGTAALCGFVFLAGVACGAVGIGGSVVNGGQGGGAGGAGYGSLGTGWKW